MLARNEHQQDAGAHKEINAQYYTWFAVFARFSDLIASQIGTTPYKSRLILYYGSE
jgi:hypothetical protein